jgi:hypothetical protein
MLLNLGTRVRVNNDDNVVEARGVGVGGDEVNHALTVQADGGELLHAAVATGPSGGKDY